MANIIFKKVECAFQAGEVTKELLQLIVILSSLSDKTYTHIQSIISRDLMTTGDVRKYGPTEIRKFLEGEQTLIDADKSIPAPTDPAPTAFTARISKYDWLTCKTVEESRQARLAYYDAQWKDRDSKKKTSRVTITLNGGTAFTIEGDLEAIAAYIATQGGKQTTSVKPEFAGITSDSILTSYIKDIEAMEFETLVAVEEECGYVKHTQEVSENESYLSSSSSIPLDILPFYLDSGTMVHISPD
ncbi:hypothetical protein E4T56_gene17209 [Termitomyces sp. T112]|nr:hypothetical protein E4T56_gene17209 [Termitomyces sp. T112]